MLNYICECGSCNLVEVDTWAWEYLEKIREQSPTEMKERIVLKEHLELLPRRSYEILDMTINLCIIRPLIVELIKNE